MTQLIVVPKIFFKAPIVIGAIMAVQGLNKGLLVRSSYAPCSISGSPHTDGLRERFPSAVSEKVSVRLRVRIPSGPNRRAPVCENRASGWTDRRRGEQVVVKLSAAGGFGTQKALRNTLSYTFWCLALCQF